MDLEALSMDELFFFDQKREALPLYLALRDRMEKAGVPGTFQAKKTQISFINRHLFGAASYLPVLKAKDRPKPFLTVTFGLDRRLDSPRIHGAVEAYPNRWTHHIVIGKEEELDQELMDWLMEASLFAAGKR